MRNSLLSIAGAARICSLSRTCPQSCLPDGIPRERGKVLREDKMLSGAKRAYAILVPYHLIANQMGASTLRQRLLMKRPVCPTS